MKAEKSEHQLWLEKYVPLALRDEGANLFDERPLLKEYIQQGFNNGYTARRLEDEKKIQELEAHCAGLKLALQEKIEVVQKVNAVPRRWYQFWK